MTVFVVLLVCALVFVEIFFLKLLLNLSMDIHRRAREILYAQDHGLKIDRKAGIMESLAHRQAAKSAREREKDLPKIGDLITLKPMYSHMFNVKDNPTYLVVGYTLNQLSENKHKSDIELQRVDKQYEVAKISMKISDWDRNRYDIINSSWGEI